MILMPNITDDDRAKFLNALSDSARTDEGVMLSTWETNFVGTFKNVYRAWQFWTPGRRKATDALRAKFGDLIGMPFPLAPTTAVQLAPADPTGCEFMMRDEERRMVRCNAPAEVITRLKFRLCGQHNEQVQRDLARRGGKTMIVEKINQGDNL